MRYIDAPRSVLLYSPCLHRNISSSQLSFNLTSLQQNSLFWPLNQDFLPVILSQSKEAFSCGSFSPLFFITSQAHNPTDYFLGNSSYLFWPVLCAIPSHKSHPDYCTNFLAGHTGFIWSTNISGLRLLSDIFASWCPPDKIALLTLFPSLENQNPSMCLLVKYRDWM